MGKVQITFAFSVALAAAACGGGNDHPIGGDDTTGGDGSVADARPDGPGPALDAGPDALGNGVAPVITVISPAPGGLVAGQLEVVVSVADSDGVASVSATIAGIHTIAMSPSTGDRWHGSYDSTQLAGLVFPTIVVRAEDNAGETSQLGFEITLDNQAPIASLDPPEVRESKDDNGVLDCSDGFDPVGSDAPDDGSGVAQLIEFRARVLDLPNTATQTSEVYIPMAGVQSAVLYVLDDETKPLIVDSDGDGVCDMVNPQIVPATVPTTSNEAATVALDPVASGGKSYFGDTTFAGGNAAACSLGNDSTVPAQLCLSAQATRAISTPVEHFPEIYGIPPVGTLTCMGYAFDARASNISDGWACAAIETSDALGNTRVSPVERVCIDADHDHAEGCPDWNTVATSGLPDCTGSYDPQSGIVTSTPCTMPRSFFDSGTPNDDELIRNDL